LRWLDKQHDFEKGLKTEANKLIREHFGIGTRNDAQEFKKTVATIPPTLLVNNKTTSSKDVLHETVDFELLSPGFHDNQDVTVSFPDPANSANTASDKTYTHRLPTILPEINLNDITANENLLVTYPAGDLLVDIIVNDKHELDDAAGIALTRLRTYLGVIAPRAYSKDAANINTQVFVNLFGQADTSYFKDILDPASEQSTIIQGHVRMTILFCYIDGNTPIYITLEKRNGDNAQSRREWYYRFHTGPVQDTPARFHVWDFGQTTSGAHPCPSIETTVHYITKNIDGRTATAGLQAISNFVSRQVTKLTPAANKTKLSKGQLQNANHYKLNAFDTFYEAFLRNFQTDIGLTAIQFTNNIKKIVVMSFKTIGDQMYLYDAALIATVGAVPGSDPIPTVVSGDTFLRDYIIYTKSADIICPTTIGNTRGKRKLKVYLKPRITDPAILQAATEAAAAAAAAALAALGQEGDNLLTQIVALMPTHADETVMTNVKTNIQALVPIFGNMISEGSRIATVLSYTLPDYAKIVVDGNNVMALYYLILEALLLRDGYNILKIESNAIKEILIESGFINQESVFLPGERTADTIIRFNNYLHSWKKCLINMNEIVATTTNLNTLLNPATLLPGGITIVNGMTMANGVPFIDDIYNFNFQLTRIKSSYPRGVSRKYLPYNVMEKPAISLKPMNNELADIFSQFNAEDASLTNMLGGGKKLMDGKWYTYVEGTWVLDPKHTPLTKHTPLIKGVNGNAASARRVDKYNKHQKEKRNDLLVNKRYTDFVDRLKSFVETRLSSLNQLTYRVQSPLPVNEEKESFITEIAELFNVIDELVSKEDPLNREYSDDHRGLIIQNIIKPEIASLVEKIGEVLIAGNITIGGCLAYIDSKGDQPITVFNGSVGTSALGVAAQSTASVFGMGWSPQPTASVFGMGWSPQPTAAAFGGPPAQSTAAWRAWVKEPQSAFGTGWTKQRTESVVGGPHELVFAQTGFRVRGGRKSKKRMHHLKINPSVKNKRRSNKKKSKRQKSRHNYTLKVNRYRKKN
jgi:hypothetical protein